MPLVAPKILSDEEMSALEGGSAPAPKKILSDEEMAALEGGNPSNMRAARAKPTDLLGKFKEAGYKTATPGFFHDLLHGGTGALDTLTLGNLQDKPSFNAALEEAKTESPSATRAGRVVGALGLAGATTLAPELTIPRVGVSATPVLLGAAQGFAEKPAPGADELSSRIGQAKFGGLVGGAGQAAGALSGKIGDYLMQKALGMRELAPGMGAKAAGEGLVGTKSMMKGQIEKKLPGLRAETNAAAADIPGSFSPYDSAKAISDYIKTKRPMAGLPSDSMPQNAENIAEAANRLRGIVGRPDMSAPELLDAARKIGSQAYREGDPMAGIKATLNRIDAGTMKGQLKNISPGVKSGLGREATLETAKNALETPQSINDYLRAAGRFGGGAAGAAGLGYLANGNEGAALGGIAGAIGSTSAAKSAAAQLLLKGAAGSRGISAALIDHYLRQKRDSTNGGRSPQSVSDLPVDDGMSLFDRNRGAIIRNGDVRGWYPGQNSDADSLIGNFLFGKNESIGNQRAKKRELKR